MRHRPAGYLFAGAVAVMTALGCSSDSPITPPGGGSVKPTPLSGTLAVGDLVLLNVEGDSACTSPKMHVAQVMAIGDKSIIFADTLNPKGGFTTADYQNYAAKFDTLIYPLDVSAFGAPTDIDNNGKIGLIFTRAVNELTEPHASSYVGGFTFSRDLFPVTANSRAEACATSNQGEFFYLLAPDPSGVVNGNVRTAGFVDSATVSVIAHEFQHLINASRKIYVNTAATDFEVKWLDEGLAHTAEELLFYRESGLAPRNDIGATAIRSSSRSLTAFNLDMIGNTGRYKSYLQKPGTSSPYAPDDSLSTRGGAWSWLRYMADHKISGTTPTAGASTALTGPGTISLDGGTTGADYAVVVVNPSQSSGTAASFTLATGNVVAPVGSLLRAPLGSPTLSRIATFDFSSASAPVRNVAFETRHRATERALMPRLASGARAWYRANRGPTGLSATMGRSSSLSVGRSSIQDVVPGTSVDGDIWYRLVNNTVVGLPNVASVFGVTVGSTLRDWSVSNEVDDVAGTAREYQQLSWDWHNVFSCIGNSATCTNPYPLVIQVMANNSTYTGRDAAGGASYYRAGVAAGTTATLTFTDASASLQLVAVRTR
ncbi:MAG: Peptidase hyicolysin [Gemmatimonadetes bacterium]|jgi:hypothetical protein|nr:Peptidase hyicolysin [Gemmatimonadota bacterium]